MKPDQNELKVSEVNFSPVQVDALVGIDLIRMRHHLFKHEPFETRLFEYKNNMILDS